MTYFLDFDHTLFDSARYLSALAARFGLSEEEVIPEYHRQLEEGRFSFTPGELALYLYPDVPEFLRMIGNSGIILTYGDPIVQRAKIESALAHIPRVTVFYAGSEKKGTYLKQRLLAFSDPIFVDDLPEHLENMQEECPTVRLFEMRRDGGSGDGRWPVIRSLTELP